ncbi:MAG: inositol monophosphatase [Rhizobiales bacterium 65-79]|jgi:myo-inositol-1(or 4)-monophosphatase|nr:inositol monophosphatase [Hyphomicrobiales bacterium]OJU03362.1 MAG: inositol monophosphatase [Rhizobiales bacterium 65-79]
MTVHVSVDIQSRFDLAKEIARTAGALAFEHFKARDRLVIESKATLHDVVSAADREVEELIRSRVAAAFPGDGMLGEEYGLAAGGEYTWVVDPIDGTIPFVAGMPSWCVSIAVLKGEGIVVGAIYAPVVDELYAAARGLGATLDGRPLVLDNSLTLKNRTLGFGANHHASPEVVAGFIRRLLEEGGNFMRNGSGALSLAYVAAGRLAGYYEPYMHAWDCMAGYCLVAEAGGWHRPFPVAAGGLTKGATVIAAAPGAVGDLRRLAEN